MLVSVSIILIMGVVRYLTLVEETNMIEAIPQAYVYYLFVRFLFVRFEVKWTFLPLRIILKLTSKPFLS